MVGPKLRHPVGAFEGAHGARCADRSAAVALGALKASVEGSLLE